MQEQERIAVVLFNLGGPDKPSAVEPFLFNLFHDPEIISLPNPLRWLVARLVSKRRAGVAREIYAHLGGGSPILPHTRDQATALEARFTDDHAMEVRCFIAMRYWHPFSNEAIEAIQDWKPGRIVLLPLYPQFSRTTTGSSLKDWDKTASRLGLDVPVHRICCYPEEEYFIKAHTDLLEKALAEAKKETEAETQNIRILFSAHGLPKRVIEGGDPYQRHVEQTCQAIVTALNRPGLDWVCCYQSRVGPLQWIGPSTEEEIRRAGQDKKGVIIVPVAFVSEHSETLVELDREYRQVARLAGVDPWIRVPAPGSHPFFIDQLETLVRTSLESQDIFCPAAGKEQNCLEVIQNRQDAKEV